MTEEQTPKLKIQVRERSASYPSITLEDAVNYSVKLQIAFSKSAFNRDNAAKEMGYEKVTGPIGMKVASLVHYGLLDRDGNAYRNSDLALHFAHTIDDNDLRAAKRSAVTNPKLYKTLLNEFAGRAVPTALSSILVRNHKIGQNVATSVANIFRKSIEYAGLYENGIVTKEVSASEENVEASESFVQTPAKSPQNPIRTSPISNANSQSNMVTVEFPSGISLSYPKSLTFAFNMGTFREQMAALEQAVKEEIKKHESNSTKDDISSTN